MLTVTYLGTGAAVPLPGRDNTSLAVDDGTEVTLVDASGSPLRRLAEAGIAPERLARVIITHQHLDHSYGLPSLLQSLWLSGRTAPLPVYALDSTWRFLDRLIDAFRPTSWADAFPVGRQLIETGQGPLVASDGLEIDAVLTEHSVPSVGVRFRSAAGSAAVYSSDTAPCAAIRGLARDAHLLIHEATYLGRDEVQAARQGHSTAFGAARLAAEAGARALALVHFSPGILGDLPQLETEAARGFSGPLSVPGDQYAVRFP
jgi:ribonuclease Z